MARRGAQLTITPERIAQARQIAVVSPHKATVANYLGVSRGTLYTWLERGHDAQTAIERGQKITKEDQMCLDLLHALCTGEAGVDLGALGTLVQAAKSGDTAAARWLLERRHPERYDRRIIQLEGGEQPIRVAHSVDEGELAEQVGRMLERMRGAVIDVEPLDELEAGED